jgi:hypothetical protein
VRKFPHDLRYVWGVIKRFFLNLLTILLPAACFAFGSLNIYQDKRL